MTLTSYRARDTPLGRDVAIKVLPEALAKDADRLRRFEQEARTIAALNHPNILGIHDVGAREGAPFLVSELLEGQTLREKLESGPLPVRRAIDYAVVAQFVIDQGATVHAGMVVIGDRLGLYKALATEPLTAPELP
jgi:eukaryotic-like serine/threonine-protein kinase